MTITLNCISEKLLSSISFSSFSGNSTVSLIGACFFISTFWLSLCVCFYVLDRIAMASSLPEVELLGPNDTVSLIFWVGYSRDVPCVDFVVPPVVIGTWLLLAHSCVGSTLRLPDYEVQLWPHLASYYTGDRQSSCSQCCQLGRIPTSPSTWSQTKTLRQWLCEILNYFLVLHFLYYYLYCEYPSHCCWCWCCHCCCWCAQPWETLLPLALPHLPTAQCTVDPGLELAWPCFLWAVPNFWVRPSITQDPVSLSLHPFP